MDVNYPKLIWQRWVGTTSINLKKDSAKKIEKAAQKIEFAGGVFNLSAYIRKAIKAYEK